VGGAEGGVVYAVSWAQAYPPQQPNPLSFGTRLLGCAAQHFGLTAIAGGVGILGGPVPKAAVIGRTAATSGASETMSVASTLEWELFGSAGPKIGGRLFGTTRLFGILGRAAPYISAALLSYDASAIGVCVYTGGP